MIMELVLYRAGCRRFLRGVFGVIVYLKNPPDAKRSGWGTVFCVGLALFLRILKNPPVHKWDVARSALGGVPKKVRVGNGVSYRFAGVS